jgi:hypothetical protein
MKRLQDALERGRRPVFVKSSGIGILFPIFIALLVPVRLLAGRIFEAEHLAALDAEEEPEEEETDWAG